MIFRIDCIPHERWKAYTTHVGGRDKLPENNVLVENGICIESNDIQYRKGQKLAYLINVNINPFAAYVWSNYDIELSVVINQIIIINGIKNWIFVRPSRTISSATHMSGGGIFFAFPSIE